ncbi:uncharacterized protein LOC126830237 [Patella vulgata]|uniref:uncharacterized protein LOC126830237 n=1 Tax=Patella vulgata TaxID=6465 RepID=UPI0021801FE2|nr:uncharacterized protein LOC126830237 [Patella vulgata]XP_055959037.1 uncharacterized protein LOC126830237 [Patella vulgata]
MKSLLKTIIRTNFGYYSSNISYLDIMIPMVELNVLSNEEYFAILNENGSWDKKAQKVLYYIMERTDVSGFEQMLRYNNAHTFVINKFIEQKNEAMINHTPREKGICRISTVTTRYKKIKQFGLGLKQLIHSGNQDDFNRAAQAVHEKWRTVESLNSRDEQGVVSQKEVADLLFYTLDAQIENLRVHFDPNIYNHQYFKQMEQMIKYTTEPHVSSMMFLARYGSALTHKESLEKGMSELACALDHSRRVEPCKESGMVYYIEINMLFKKYEAEGQLSIKEELLDKTNVAISQFENEQWEIKEDYKRMLLLKRVYVYLALGVHGEEMKNISWKSEDLNQAKYCLNEIKESESQLDDRRRMFYYTAEAIWNERTGNVERALGTIKEALSLAKRGQFTKEESAINEHIKRMIGKNEKRKGDRRQEALKNMTEILPDINNALTVGLNCSPGSVWQVRPFLCRVSCIGFCCAVFLSLLIGYLFV